MSPSVEEEKRVYLGIDHIQGNEAFNGPPPPIIYHYTNLEGAAGIVRSRSLWLTNVHYLNDSRELKHAIDLARAVAPELMAQNRSATHYQVLSKFTHQLASFENTNICVASFCEDGDLLSQWRGYGSSGQGVCLGFSGKALAGLGPRHSAKLLKCVYDPMMQRQVVQNFLAYLAESYRTIESDIVPYFNSVFLQMAPALKDRAFREEQEWRIATMPVKETNKNYDVRTGFGRLVPFYKLDFPEDQLATLVEESYIGPSALASHNAQALGTLLRKAGLTTTIRHSSVPYRRGAF